ncbi:MAG: glycosyltransferase family 39 protein [Patescibacteria group bacterium]|nr:glycosyltransferase family 39 protein [Patescibacteria group bacterium]MDE2438644.1 glycosyltransferase family 39 protein [Patescibacteria group bacterium]
MFLVTLIRRIPSYILVLIVLTALILMLIAARGDSAIADEQAHIPAGYGYVSQLDYRLNPEHPPLLKAAAAFPLLFLHLNFPTNDKSWTTEVNGQWDMGTQFLYNSGNNADTILFVARLAPILLTLVLGIFIYVWSSEFLGTWWALLPALLTLFSPNFLGNGHYVTTDVAAVFGFVIGLYFFCHLLEENSRGNVIRAGIALGIAELMKFSTILLPPFFVLLVIIHALTTHRYSRRTYLAMLVWVFLIAGVTIYIPYFLTTLHYPIYRQIADTATLLSGINNPLLTHAIITMASSSFLRPFGEYFLGVAMVVQRTVGGNTAYFLGNVANFAHWYYFPVVFFYKEPIPSLILMGWAFLLSLSSLMRCAPRMWGRVIHSFIRFHFTEFTMLLFAVLYFANAMASNLNIGLRHILPTIPFFYMLTAKELKQWTAWKPVGGFQEIIIEFKKNGIRLISIILLLVWYCVETFSAAPLFLSYFNEFAGGTWSGYHIVTDSNYDWGQDLKRLAAWTHTHHVDHIAVDYFGGGSPSYYLGGAFEPWWSAKGVPQGFFAISVNKLQLASSPAEPPLTTDNSYAWLKKYTPIARAGASIFIYHIP